MPNMLVIYVEYWTKTHTRPVLYQCLGQQCVCVCAMQKMTMDNKINGKFTGNLCYAVNLIIKINKYPILLKIR